MDGAIEHAEAGAPPDRSFPPRPGSRGLKPSWFGDAQAPARATELPGSRMLGAPS
jgi:hypothetical protein